MGLNNSRLQSSEAQNFKVISEAYSWRSSFRRLSSCRWASSNRWAWPSRTWHRLACTTSGGGCGQDGRTMPRSLSRCTQPKAKALLRPSWLPCPRDARGTPSGASWRTRRPSGLPCWHTSVPSAVSSQCSPLCCSTCRTWKPKLQHSYVSVCKVGTAPGRTYLFI